MRKASSSRPVLFLSLLTIFVAFQGLATEQLGVLPRWTSKLDEVIVMTTFLGLTTLSLTRFRLKKYLLNPVLLSFLTLGLISYIVNQSWFINFALGLLVLLQYYCVYLLIIHFKLDADSSDRLIKQLVIIGLCTVPIAVLQFIFLIKPGAGPVPDWDLVIGPFFEGTANIFAYFCGYILFVLMAKIVFLKSGRKKHTIAFLAMLIPYFLCSGKSAYYLMPVALLFMFFERLRTDFIKVLLFSFLFVAIFWFVSVKLYGVSFSSQFSVSKRIEENMTTKGLNMGRLVYLKMSQDILSETWWRNIVGVGPGMFSSYPAREIGSPYLSDFLLSDHTNMIPSNVLAVRTEMGNCGLILFLLLPITAYRRARKNIDWNGDARWRLVALRGCIVYFLIGALAENVWESQVTAYFFWLLAGLLASNNFSKRNVNG